MSLNINSKMSNFKPTQPVVLAPLSVGIITSRHYLSERNKNGELTSETRDNKSGEHDKTVE